MKLSLPIVAAAGFWALSPAAAAQTDYAPAAARMMDTIKVLSSDAFEGRGPGTPGEEKTIAFLNDAFGKLGLKPGNPDGTRVHTGCPYVRDHLVGDGDNRRGE